MSLANFRIQGLRQEDLQTILHNIQGREGLDVTMMRMGMVIAKENPAKLNKFTRNMSSPNWWDKLYEGWISSLLLPS